MTQKEERNNILQAMVSPMPRLMQIEHGTATPATAMEGTQFGENLTQVSALSSGTGYMQNVRECI